MSKASAVSAETALFEELGRCLERTREQPSDAGIDVLKRHQKDSEPKVCSLVGRADGG
jgi:hypothetical protein